MRLALLGPAEDDVAALARAAHTALVGLRADRVIYLGGDLALDAVVAGWAELLGARAPLASRIGALLEASPERLDEELARERARVRLQAFRTLPDPGVRTIEMLGERITLLVDDKTDLDEEDLLPASLIVFGRGEPTIRRVGSRVFVCPGTPARGAGIAVLDEGSAGSALTITLHEVEGAVRERELVESTRSAKLRIQGAAG